MRPVSSIVALPCLAIAAIATLGVARPAIGQAVGSWPPIYEPPGYYGMAYGVPSFGVPRTSSNFASPFGGYGYGYGYDPYAILPGPYGAGIWRPGFVEPGYFYARGYYRTFPVPRGSIVPPPGVPVGYYAPALGPPLFPRP